MWMYRVCIISVNQPYFFPYLTYLKMIRSSDVFVSFDVAKVGKKNFGLRNKIFDEYISDSKWFSICKSTNQSYKDRLINIKADDIKKYIFKIVGDSKKGFKKGLRKSMMNKLDVFLSNVTQSQFNTIGEVNLELIKCFFRYLDIEKKIINASELPLPPKETKKDEFGLYYTKYLKGDKYINLPGGQSFFNINKYRTTNIDIEFMKIFEYSIPELKLSTYSSMLDIVLLIDPQTIRKLLNS